MSVRLELLKKKDLELFEKSHEEAFMVHAKYFKDGLVPGPDQQDEAESFNSLFMRDDTTFLGIYDDNKFIGGAIVIDEGNYVSEINLFFLIVEYQSKGLGKDILTMVENYFPDTKVFRLITPTQVVRNSVFYINKCGYKIVKVIDFNKEENSADYLFEKVRQ